MAKARGGKRPGAGRPAGVPNKSTADLKAYAGQYSTEAIDGILAIARDGGTPPQAKVAAWREILDRAHGRPAQALTGPDGERLEVPQAVRFVVEAIPGSHNKS
jgi:hypothetical protein